MTLAQIRAETKPPVSLGSTSLWCDADQEHHRGVILNMINTANIKMLQSIPAIGPKTAYLIQSYRYERVSLGRSSVYLVCVDVVTFSFFSKMH